MRFGLGPVTAQNVPFDDRDVHEIYSDQVDIIAAAENYGFDSAWVTEHHFVPDSHVTSPLSFLAAAASRTDEIELGTSIMIASFYDPIKLAEDTATIDQLSGGRLTVGLGLGYREEEFAGFNVSKGERVQRLKETTAFLKRAWQRDCFSFAGEIYQYENLTITPRPYQKPRPDVWLGAVSEGAVRRAAAIGDRWIAGQFHHVEGIKKRIDWYRDVEADESVDFPILRHCFVSEDGAWESVKDSIEYIERQHYDWDDAEWSPEALDHIRENGIFGTPDEVVDQIQTYDDKIEEELHMILWFCYPGINKVKIVDSMELFANEVRPHLEE